MRQDQSLLGLALSIVTKGREWQAQIVAKLVITIYEASQFDVDKEDGH